MFLDAENDPGTRSKDVGLPILSRSGLLVSHGYEHLLQDGHEAICHSTNTMCFL